jgi:hypothetical protein
MYFIVDIIFHTICGWIGATFLKPITFGRIDLDWGEGCCESILAEWTGLVVLVGLIVLATVLWTRLA